MVIKMKKKVKREKVPKELRGEGLTAEDLEPPKLLKQVDYQIGETNKKIDAKFVAQKPGKRRSKYGNTYYEYRKNRSDLRKGI